MLIAGHLPKTLISMCTEVHSWIYPCQLELVCRLYITLHLFSPRTCCCCCCCLLQVVALWAYCWLKRKSLCLLKFPDILQSVDVRNHQIFSVCISIEFLNRLTHFDEIWFQRCAIVANFIVWLQIMLRKYACKNTVY